MNHTVPAAPPGDHGCRTRGGCTPDDRCLDHRANPDPVGHLLAQAYSAIARRAGRRHLHTVRSTR
jgi:hypothetical protein